MASVGVVVKGLLLLVAMLVAALVQGCGCNTENVEKCTKDNPAPTGTTDMAATCKYVDAIVKCWKDKGCCDNKDAKTSMDSLKAFSAAPYNCQITTCS